MQRRRRAPPRVGFEQIGNLRGGRRELEQQDQVDAVDVAHGRTGQDDEVRRQDDLELGVDMLRFVAQNLDTR